AKDSLSPVFGRRRDGERYGAAVRCLRRVSSAPDGSGFASLATAPAARAPGRPGAGGGWIRGQKKVRKSAVKPLKSLARVNLCAGRRAGRGRLAQRRAVW